MTDMQTEIDDLKASRDALRKLRADRDAAERLAECAPELLAAAKLGLAALRRVPYTSPASADAIAIDALKDAIARAESR